jgi:uncharacterized membrane protein
VHSEGLTGGLFRVRPADVDVYRDALSDLRERSMSAEMSRTAVAEREEALRLLAAS